MPRQEYFLNEKHLRKLSRNEAAREMKAHFKQKKEKKAIPKLTFPCFFFFVFSYQTLQHQISDEGSNEPSSQSPTRFSKTLLKHMRGKTSEPSSWSPHQFLESVLYTHARNTWRSNGTSSVTHTKVKSSEHALQSVLEMQVKRNQNIQWKKEKEEMQNGAQMCVRKPRAWDEKLLFFLLNVFLETCKGWHPSPLSTPFVCPSKEHGCENTCSTPHALPVWHISHCCQARLPICPRETTATSPLRRGKKKLRQVSIWRGYDENVGNHSLRQGNILAPTREAVTAPKRSGWLMHNLKINSMRKKRHVSPLEKRNCASTCLCWGGGIGGEGVLETLSHIMDSHGLQIKYRTWQISSAEFHEDEKVSWMERFVTCPTVAWSYKGNP